MVIRLDRFTKAMLVLLVVGVYGLLLSLIFQGQPVVAQGTADVLKWEYTWLDNGRIDNGKRMDELGKKGWEMFAATVNDANNGVQYYKRRINQTRIDRPKTIHKQQSKKRENTINNSIDTQVSSGFMVEENQQYAYFTITGSFDPIEILQQDSLGTHQLSILISTGYIRTIENPQIDSIYYHHHAN